jgi:hypothetical protein
VKLRCSWVFIALAFLVAGPSRLLGSADTNERPSDLWVLRHDSARAAEMVLAQTLQGLIGRDSPKLWLDKSGMSAVILNQLQQEGVRIHRVTSVWDLPEELWQPVSGAIVYNLNTHSLNAAVSLCGPWNAVAVDESLLDQALAFGLEVVYDARGQSEDQIFDEYGELFSRGIAVEQTESKPAYLRDFAVLNNAFTFYGFGSSFRRRVAETVGPRATIFGWGPSEFTWISDFSRSAGGGVAADWCVNLSAMSKLPVDIPLRPVPPPPAPARVGERVVAFVLSDGDNIQWLTGGMPLDPKWFANPSRGDFQMNWEVSPLLAGVAPRVLKYFYDQATEKDSFVAAGSPSYRYIHLEPDPRGVVDALESEPYLQASHLNIVSVINDNAGSLAETIPLLESPQVLGVIYKKYSPYEGLHGETLWHWGKPAVSYKFVLWENHAGGSVEEVAAAINAMPQSPGTDSSSYALINVHAWSFRDSGGPVEAVSRTIALLHDTRVVSVEDFFALLKDNCRNFPEQPCAF